MHHRYELPLTEGRRWPAGARPRPRYAFDHVVHGRGVFATGPVATAAARAAALPAPSLERGPNRAGWWPTLRQALRRALLWPRGAAPAVRGRAHERPAGPARAESAVERASSRYGWAM